MTAMAATATPTIRATSAIRTIPRPRIPSTARTSPAPSALQSTNNAIGIAGGAWDVTIVPVRALGRCGGKLSDINDAIRWAAGKVPARDGAGNEVWNANPADIINLSIGLFEPCPASMQAAINDAVAAGAIVVVGGGQFPRRHQIRRAGRMRQRHLGGGRRCARRPHALFQLRGQT